MSESEGGVRPIRARGSESRPGGICSRREGNVISESPGVGMMPLRIPRLWIGFVPCLSLLTHWLPAWESPGQPAGFSLPLGVSWKQKQLFHSVVSRHVPCPGCLEGKGAGFQALLRLPPARWRGSRLGRPQPLALPTGGTTWPSPGPVGCFGVPGWIQDDPPPWPP